MVNFEIDDKKLERERRRMEEEQKKLQKEQEKALKQQNKKNKKVKKPADSNNSGETKYEKYKTPQTKKIISIFGVILLILLVLLLKNPFMQYVESVKNETQIGENETIMVDIIGFDMDSAIKELEKNEIKYNIIYIIDDFSMQGNVVKTNVNIGTYIDKETPVKVYVCDNGKPDKDVSHSIKTESTPFVKDSIDVLDFYVKNGDFHIVIQNNNQVVLSEIEYTVGFGDSFNSKIGNKTYKEFDLFIQPGEKYVLKNKIKDNDVHYLTIENFNCSIYSETGEK